MRGKTSSKKFKASFHDLRSLKSLINSCEQTSQCFMHYTVFLSRWRLCSLGNVTWFRGLAAQWIQDVVCGFNVMTTQKKVTMVLHCVFISNKRHSPRLLNTTQGKHHHWPKPSIQSPRLNVKCWLELLQGCCSLFKLCEIKCSSNIKY